jgi:tetratricopeptide (TPR) repeat protein
MLFSLRFSGNLAESSGQMMANEDLARMGVDVKYEGALHLSDDNSEKPLRLIRAADLFLGLYQQSHQTSDLDKAVVAYETAIRLTPDGHQCQAKLHGDLGIALFHRIEYASDIVDIENAIFAFQCSIMLTPDTDADKPSRLNNLRNCYMYHFKHSKDLVDVDNAISAQEQAVDLTPDDHADKPARLSTLGYTSIRRLELLGKAAVRFNLDDIGKSRCLQLQSHEKEILDKAISAYETAIRLTPPDDHSQAMLHSNLGIALLRRIECFGDIVDIDNAAFAFECKLLFTHDDVQKPDDLSNLGMCFMYRFEHSRELDDIEKVISAYEDAVHLTPDSHAVKPRRLNILGYSVMRRFERSGNLVDIDKAISAHEQALRLTPNGHPDKADCLNSIGQASLCRFNHSRKLVDIDNAVSAHNQAIQLTPDGHVLKLQYLNNLGNCLSTRFECSGELVDIHKAISTQQQAVRLTHDGHTDRPRCLSNLGSSFLGLFERSGALTDINNAISTHEQALHLTLDGHVDKPRFLANLGNSFMSRFKHSEDFADIDNAISCNEDAVRLIPDDHPAKAGCLGNLGNSFLCRFKCTRDLIDINEAISAQEEAVHLIPDDYADKSDILHNLGHSFSYRFEHSQDLADSSTAVSHFRSAATSTTGSPSLRFRSAVLWARLCSTTDILSSLQGYTLALDLLPQVTWLGQTIQARHRELTAMGSVASEAAAVAISAAHYDTALEWLEQGRSIVWNQLLQLRSPVDTLHEVQPGLADDLMRVSKALERASSRGIGSQDIFTQTDLQLSREEIAQGHRRLAEQWETLVEKAREVPGFEDFLRPKRLRQLCSAADSGPIVVINVHRSRCDALALMAGLDEVMHIPLARFSYEKAQEMHRSLNRLLSAAHVRARDTRAMKRVATTTGTGFPTILSDLWSYVAKPVLDGLAFTVSY